jgi:hypothetical protein
MESVLDDGMASTKGKHPETAQEIQVPLSLVVNEVTALAMIVEAVESEGFDHLGQLWIEVLLVKLEVLTVARGE